MMKKNLYRAIDSFLEKFIPKGSKVLLAYSGGPDSVALLHLMLRSIKNHPFTLELAHVDHGQRRESKEEATQVQFMAQENALALHLKVLAPPSKGNLENYYREERLNFFSSLVKEKGYDAVLLAHHLDDLKETVLKRFLEGASFEHFKGIQMETYFKGIRLLRPLLNVPKNELLFWLKEQSIAYFTDNTNEDTDFLRARMRKELFPFIEQNFGKGIQDNLLWIAKQSANYQNYLEKQVQNKFCVASSPFGFSIDFRKKGAHSLEVEYFLKKTLRNKGYKFSREQYEKVTESLINQKPTKMWKSGDDLFYTDKGLFFYLAKPDIPQTSKDLLLEPGIYTHYFWKLEVQKTTEHAEHQLGWRRLFDKQPKFIIYLPLNQKIKIKFHSPYAQRFYFEKKISKWWEDHKVPSFLRNLTPVLEVQDGLIGEFLTQKAPYELEREKLKLTICYQKPLK